MYAARMFCLRATLASPVALIAMGTLAAPASAETLQDALEKAYRNNPTISGARANQRALDEDVNIARANGRPSSNITTSYTEELFVQINSQFSSAPARILGAQGQLTAPIYSGGTVANAVHASKLRAEAGRNNVLGTEGSIFSQVVGAYMDVIRDSEILKLRAQNVEALDLNLRVSRDRFEVGDLTRTDVAQSESRLAIARSDLETAQAQLISSKENYLALVGSAPGQLEAPAPLANLPDTPETAVTVALADNPDIRAAAKNQNAARYDVKAAQGAVLPRVSGFANGSYTNYLNSINSTFPVINVQKGASAGATVTIPLYQGGRPGATQRQAVARESAAIEQSISVERGVISQVRAAYASWQASLQSIAANETAVRASELALEGVKAENSVGNRTVLDILNAEQESLNAHVNLVVAKRNAYVAAFTLLTAMGHAGAPDLGISRGGIYDPAANDERVNSKFFDYDFDRRAKPQTTSTVTTAPQDAKPVSPPDYGVAQTGPGH